jgi:3-oxoacyl-[acyl-carrier protein] reductase
MTTDQQYGSRPLQTRRAFVCGSTQGIGKHCAIEFARLGASCTLVARNEQALRIVCDELPRVDGQTHDYIVADFADYEDLRGKVAQYVHDEGPAQLLLNNTGGPPPGPAFEGTPEDYLDAYTKHVVCNQVLVQGLAEGMREAAYGRIINIISTSVFMPIRNLGVSNTVRAAVANWARTLAAELGPFGITVNNVLPGFTKTARLDKLIEGRANRAGQTIEATEQEMFATIPARRFGTPKEIAAVAGFLATPAAAYVNGVSIPVDGGRLAAQ